MKKILFLPLFAALTTPVLVAGDTESVLESITLTSDNVVGETFTESAAGNGMFYSDSNKVGFIAAGTAENPYYISAADDTNANKDDISLSYGSGTTVSVGSFTGDSHLVIGTQDTPVRVYTENSLFVGGYGWHGTSGWRNNAELNSSTRGDLPFVAHEGSITINKGSTLDTGTGANALGGTQIRIGHGGKGTVTVDGGTLTSRALIAISSSTATDDDNSGLLEIKNGGKVYLKAEPDQIKSYYNQLMIGASNTGKGSLVISGEGSEMVMESSALTPQQGTGQTSFWSYVSIGTYEGGNGEVTVSDSATLTLGTENAGNVQISLGEGSGSTGALKVTENATANLNGTTIVGFQGTATVNIQSGGSVNQTSGALFVGYSGGSGDVTVGEASTLTAQSVYVGVNDAKGSVTVEKDSVMNVAGDLLIYDTLNDGIANSLVNSGTVNVGGSVSLTDGTTATNSGAISAGNVYIAAGAELSNTGSLEISGGEGGIVLSEGARINNAGSLSGKISGNGSVEGSGVIETVTIGEDTMLVVGTSQAPIVGLRATDITLASGSTTRFNVDGEEDIASGGMADWGEGMHSIIFGETVSIESGAMIEIVFSSDIFTLGEVTELDMMLISAGEGSDYGDLETMMSHTSFSLNSSVLALRSADDLTLDVSNLYYQVKDNSLYLVGEAALVPEPTTATLSLLALAALAARRRRR